MQKLIWAGLRNNLIQLLGGVTNHSGPLSTPLELTLLGHNNRFIYSEGVVIDHSEGLSPYVMRKVLRVSRGKTRRTLRMT